VKGLRHAPTDLFPGKTRYLLDKVAPWPVWTGAKNFASTGIRSQDRPARRQSLYRLRQRGPLNIYNHTKFNGAYLNSVTFHMGFVDIIEIRKIESINYEHRVMP
jgi:hypothetical protein